MSGAGSGEGGRGRRFMAAFNEIEAHFRRELRRDEFVRFMDMADEYRQRRLLTQPQHEELRVFAGLRNAIQHSRYYEGKPIAEPVEQVVVRIERLRDQLMSPPTVSQLIQGPVLTCAPSDLLRKPLRDMHARDFSQVPVYDGDRCIDLLTTNAIARWLAANFNDDGDLVHEEPRVQDVLRCAEDYEKVTALPRNAPVALALDLLSEAASGTKQLSALLVTQSGKLTERPLGLLNRFDVPALAKALQLA